MPRVPLPTRDDLPENDRGVYDRIEKSRGGVGNIWRALLNAPNIADRVLAIADELRHGTTIDKRTRELAVLMVGLVTKCQYEFDHHWNAALKAGIARAQLEALAQFETSTLLDDRERAILRFAMEVTENGDVQDATWAALCYHFDTRHAVEILLTVAWYNTVVRILLPLQIENEPTFRRQ